MKPKASPAGATTPQPQGIDPRAGDIIEHIVLAVSEGDDARIRTLLADLAAVADTAALLHLRERLYAPR
ncbi:hypothetical protein PV721_33435 [Streptomyces sp. MB09-01]|uniref:hypothetical protein n=1 Tax=Streptomyces sp. MB09-01 TaxID=3028666 RepID=UPI0029B34C4F|nr:hypothetical protein [Streptomyces sp. MB09-01]MDX3539142.1 hypothetical protein [Streptomyces sp. MB09-01]